MASRWDHPTAAVWLAHDKDSDTVHVYDCYRQLEATPVVHAAAMAVYPIAKRFKWFHNYSE